MSVKSILCVYRGEPAELNALNAALCLAKSGRAGLRILHVANKSLPLADGLGIVGYGISAYGDGTVMEIIERGERELTQTAETKAQAAAQFHGLDIAQDGSRAVLGQSHVTFRTVTGIPSEIVPREGRTVDLIVMPYESGPAGDLGVLLNALHHTGRAVLAIPNVSSVQPTQTGFARTVCIAWDGSLAASRAVREAIPHLLHADAIYLVRIQQARDMYDSVPEEDILGYLRSHCIEAVCLHVTAGQHSPGEALLQKAGSLKADLLVMGAYGHSHIGEFFFVGTTDYIVKHSHLPLLLTH